MRRLGRRRAETARCAPVLVLKSPPSAGLHSGFRSGIVVCMSTVELIVRKASALPAELQQEALHYVDYLLARQAEGGEAGEWARFSAEQLAAQFASGDAIYDQD